MRSFAQIPSSHYTQAIHLRSLGYGFKALKEAYDQGFLARWRSKKTRRIYYKNNNAELFENHAPKLGIVRYQLARQTKLQG